MTENDLLALISLKISVDTVTYSQADSTKTVRNLRTIFLIQFVFKFTGKDKKNRMQQKTQRSVCRFVSQNAMGTDLPRHTYSVFHTFTNKSEP